MQLREIGEFGLIDRIKNIVDASSAELIVGIGDDAAAFRTSTNLLTLLTTDVLIEGVHFDLEYFTFQQLGWRAFAVNLSDIAIRKTTNGIAFLGHVVFSQDLIVQAKN